MAIRVVVARVGRYVFERGICGDSFSVHRLLVHVATMQGGVDPMRSMLRRQSPHGIEDQWEATSFPAAGCQTDPREPARGWRGSKVQRLLGTLPWAAR